MRNGWDLAMALLESHLTWLEGASLAATAVAIVGVVLNNRRRRACFAVWMVSNSATLALHLATGLWGMALRDGLFLALAIHGWYAWGRTATTTAATEGTEATEAAEKTKNGELRYEIRTDGGEIPFIREMERIQREYPDLYREFSVPKVYLEAQHGSYAAARAAKGGGQ